MSQVKLTKPKNTRPIKVYSFKAELNADQLAMVQAWLNGLNRLYNEGLSALIASEQAEWREKFAPDLGARFPSMPVKLRKVAGRWKAVGAGVKTNKHTGFKYCSIAEWVDRPLPDKSLTKGTRSAQLRAYAIDCRSACNYHHPILDGMPSEFRDGCIHVLKNAWKDYKDAKLRRGRPKFKSQNHPVSSLFIRNGKERVKVSESGPNAYVTFPGLGSFKIKGYHKRFYGGLEYGKVALVQDGNDWFIQFSARYTPADSPTAQPRIVGVDPGIKAVVATSDGHVIQPRRKDAKLRQRMKRLQRKLARQQRGSKSSEATRAKIRVIHAKVRRNRKGFNARLADWLGRFDVAFEGSRLRDMSRRAAPKPKEDGTGYERNNAKAKSGLNRELLDNGLGQIRQLTEARCKSRGKRFVKTAEADVRYSSRRCYCCGELGKRSTQEKFVCLNRGCRLHGISQHADVNAAKNHAKAGYSIPSGIYPSAMGKVMGAESGATLAGQPGLQPTAKPKASKTTPLPSNGKPLQGSESVKDDATTPSGETFTHKATQRTAQKNPACNPQKVSTAKDSRVKVQAESTATPPTKRKPRRYLQRTQQDAHQLSLWDVRPAG